MKYILIMLVLCGLGMIVLSQFQRAAEIARWTQIYGVLAESSELNPLKDDLLRKKFDNLYFEDTRYA